MASLQHTKVTVRAIINAPVHKVWKTWNTPEDIKTWNTATPEWHTTMAENDLRAGGRLFSRMEAKDGSFGFDFEGIYDEVKPNEYISYTLADGRKIEIFFNAEGDKTGIVETFDADAENSIEMQQMGWQAILDNFKRYAEGQ